MYAITYSEGIEEAWNNIAAFIPKLVGALAILLIGWMIAKIIRRIAHRLLTRVKIDQLVDRSGLGDYIERAGYPDTGMLLATILYYGIMLMVLKLAVGAFGDSDIQNVLDSIIAFIPKIFVAIIIVLLTGAIANVVRNLVESAVSQVDYGRIVTQVAVGAVWVIGIFAALDQVQVAEDIVDTLFQATVASLGLIIVIKFGVGGIWAARDRFWPAVYDRVAPRKDA